MHGRKVMAAVAVALVSAVVVPAAQAKTGAWILKAGHTATLSNAVLQACDPLAYGYAFDNNRTEVDSYPGGCGSKAAAGATIGPYNNARTIHVYLEDRYNNPSDIFYSDNPNHAIVAGSNPYQVSIGDSFFGTSGPGQPYPFPFTIGNGNLNVTVTIT
ncbi:MAG: hypothetical protein QOI80_1860 [Solirubrobacteraceae bacterium]|nr:hypothetical protein [Solirubrobacteraceae bacterium]